MERLEEIMQEEVLQRARDTYGSKSQLFVCMGELGELISVLAKFPRYDYENEAIEELREDALDEVADVYVVLEHIKAIMKLDEAEIAAVRQRKIERLNRWLTSGDSLQISMTDRALRGDETNTET